MLDKEKIFLHSYKYQINSCLIELSKYLMQFKTRTSRGLCVESISVCVCMCVSNNNNKYLYTFNWHCTGVLENITKINWLLSKVYCFSSSFVLFPFWPSTIFTCGQYFLLYLYVSVYKVESVLICNKNLCKHIMRKLITFTHSPKLYNFFFCKNIFFKWGGRMLNWMDGQRMLKQ